MRATEKYAVGTRVVAAFDSGYIHEFSGVPVFQRGDVGVIFEVLNNEIGEDYFICWEKQVQPCDDGEWYAHHYEVKPYEAD